MIDSGNDQHQPDAQAETRTDNSHVFQGEALDGQAARLGFERSRGESDWDLRKRVFIDYYQKGVDFSIEGMEFLLGTTRDHYDDFDMLAHGMIRPGASREECVKFADGFAGDPIELRRQRRESIVGSEAT